MLHQCMACPSGGSSPAPAAPRHAAAARQECLFWGRTSFTSQALVLAQVSLLAGILHPANASAAGTFWILLQNRPASKPYLELLLHNKIPVKNQPGAEGEIRQTPAGCWERMQKLAKNRNASPGAWTARRVQLLPSARDFFT